MIGAQLILLGVLHAAGVCRMGSAWLMRTHDAMMRDNVWPDAAIQVLGVKRALDRREEAETLLMMLEISRSEGAAAKRHDSTAMQIAAAVRRRSVVAFQQGRPTQGVYLNMMQRDILQKQLSTMPNARGGVSSLLSESSRVSIDTSGTPSRADTNARARHSSVPLPNRDLGLEKATSVNDRMRGSLPNLGLIKTQSAYRLGGTLTNQSPPPVLSAVEQYLQKYAEPVDRLVQGARVYHKQHSYGRIAAVVNDDRRDKPYHVTFDSGEQHCYSVQSAVKLIVVPDNLRQETLQGGALDEPAAPLDPASSLLPDTLNGGTGIDGACADDDGAFGLAMRIDAPRREDPVPTVSFAPVYRAPLKPVLSD